MNSSCNCTIDDFKRSVFPTVYLMIFILGIVGHSVSIYIFFRVWKKKRSLTSVNLFMVNLLVSDLMQKESTVKRSVAELAGKFACQNPVPTGPDGNKPVRRRPPRTLELPASNNAVQGQDEQKKGDVTSHPPRRQRNSALIEKLQANLVLSPTALLPSPISPGAAKPPPMSLSSNSPCSPASPTAAPTASQEAPAGFEKPAEGNVLLSINKGRARHSIKRRPPSRRHRKSSSDEVGAEEENTASPVSESAAPGGKEEDVFKKQNTEEKEDSNAEPVSSTSEQNQSASPDSEQLPTAEEEKEKKACEEAPVSSEKEVKVEEEKVGDEEKVEEEKKVEKEEKKPDEPQLANSTSETIKHEKPNEEPATEPPQTEPDRATEDKEEQEKKEEDVGSQTEACKGSEQ